MVFMATPQLAVVDALGAVTRDPWIREEISNKVYVKHGHKWCYVGPLEAVDLTSMVTNISNYH